MKRFWIAATWAALASAFSPVFAAKPGCEFKLLPPGYYGGAPFALAKSLSSKDSKLETTIEVKYAKHEIAGCATHLRGYNGQLVGPTLRLRPGDFLKIRLKNRLPPEPTPPPADPNTPHHFNTTNFHTHGLHVSPAGNSDNVLISIAPQTDFDVEIRVPEDHPTGTFWYHAHLHGSTALQVSSGMGGALIIEDPDDPKSLDAVAEIKDAKEDIFMLQQIGYDENGTIEKYDYFAPRGWARTQRLPTINGQIMPVIEMQPGEVRRWRLIHGGVRETFMVGVRDTHLPEANKFASWPLYEIAVDGLSLGYMNRWKKIEMQPGYRVDVLVKAPLLARGETEKVYYMLDLGSDEDVSLRQVVEAQQVLAKIVVKGQAKDMALPCKVFNGPCKKLAPTRAHQDISDAELDGAPQVVHFNIAARFCPTQGGPCLTSCDSNDPEQTENGCKTRFMINAWPFNTGHVRRLVLGTASEWTLSSGLANHPFHIHVNPFQHVRKNPEGKDETVWRDTLLVRQPSDDTDPASIKIRSRYTRYVGKFVLHCHILDHEDQGMMQVVEVVTPGDGAQGH